MNALLEILSTKQWMVSPDFVHSMRGLIEHNLNAREPVGDFKRKEPVAYQIDNNGGRSAVWHLEDMEAPFVNVMTLDGPITRGGGMCTYGSAEIRNWIIKAANNKFCRGHVITVNTPGGTAWCKNDFMLGIDYAHERGQRIVALIDGMCASAGMYLAALCDEVYYTNKKDRLGCIGVMGAFYTIANGSKNTYTEETYHEIYDPESFDKNKWARDIANDNDDTLFVEELKELGVDFRNAIMRAFPNATDDHIHGKIFNAEDVEGIFTIGQNTLGGVVDRVFTLYNEEHKDELTTNNNQTMNSYENIAAAAGVQELNVSGEGAFFVTDMLDALSEHLTQAANRIAELEQQQQEAATAHETAISELKTQLATAQQDAATARQALVDRDAQIAALTAAPAPMQETSPESNGENVAVEEPSCAMPAYDYNLSPVENAKIRREHGFK